MELIPQNSKRMLVVALCGALLTLELFVFFAANTSPKGLAMPPQPDVLIYMQYARAMAEGHPYHYIAGDAPSTACTSHLYPFLLAIPYALGAHGEALYVVSLVYNILCLLLIVALVWLMARRIAPETAGYAALFAAFSGPLAYRVLQQSDIGVFTVLMLAFFAALLYERHKTAGLFLALGVWCRPDGFIVAAAMLAYGVVAHWQPQRRRLVALGLWGCGNVAGVLLLNYLLTGNFQFQSVAGKGYFPHFSFAGACSRLVTDGGALTTDFLFGLGQPDRRLYTLPLIGGLLALVGVIGRLVRTDDRTTAADGCWTLGALGALGMVASAGWQGFDHDRYLAWLFPFLALYTAVGIQQQIEKKSMSRRAWLLVGLVVVLYQAATLPFFAIENAKSVQRTVERMNFIGKAQRILPPGKRIILSSFSGAAYIMPGRSLVHAGGFITPLLVSWRDNLSNIEVLRRHPELRGDYWLIARGDTGDPLYAPFIGRQISSETICFPVASGLAVYKADWSSLLAPRTPLATNALEAVRDWQRVDELNVGYVADETAHDYRTFSRIHNLRLSVFSATCTLDNHVITEAARMVLGSDRFHIHATPGRDLRIIMRTGNLFEKTVFWFDDAFNTGGLKLDANYFLHVDVDGGDAGLSFVSVNTNQTVWSEVVLDVPGETIRRSNPELTISGDHVAAYYWFYQKPDAQTR